MQSRMGAGDQLEAYLLSLESTASASDSCDESSCKPLKRESETADKEKPSRSLVWTSLLKILARTWMALMLIISEDIAPSKQFFSSISFMQPSFHRLQVYLLAHALSPPLPNWVSNDSKSNPLLCPGSLQSLFLKLRRAILALLTCYMTYVHFSLQSCISRNTSNIIVWMPLNIASCITSFTIAVCVYLLCFPIATNWLLASRCGSLIRLIHKAQFKSVTLLTGIKKMQLTGLGRQLSCPLPPLLYRLEEDEHEAHNNTDKEDIFHFYTLRQQKKALHEAMTHLISIISTESAEFQRINTNKDDLQGKMTNMTIPLRELERLHDKLFNKTLPLRVKNLMQSLSNQLCSSYSDCHRDMSHKDDTRMDEVEGEVGKNEDNIDSLVAGIYQILLTHSSLLKTLSCWVSNIDSITFALQYYISTIDSIFGELTSNQAERNVGDLQTQDHRNDPAKHMNSNVNTDDMDEERFAKCDEGIRILYEGVRRRLCHVRCEHEGLMNKLWICEKALSQPNAVLFLLNASTSRSKSPTTGDKIDAIINQLKRALIALDPQDNYNNTINTSDSKISSDLLTLMEEMKNLIEKVELMATCEQIDESGRVRQSGGHTRWLQSDLADGDQSNEQEISQHRINDNGITGGSIRQIEMTEFGSDADSSTDRSTSERDRDVKEGLASLEVDSSMNFIDVYVSKIPSHLPLSSKGRNVGDNSESMTSTYDCIERPARRVHNLMRELNVEVMKRGGERAIREREKRLFVQDEEGTAKGGSNQSGREDEENEDKDEDEDEDGKVDMYGPNRSDVSEQGREKRMEGGSHSEDPMKRHSSHEFPLNCDERQSNEGMDDNVTDTYAFVSAMHRDRDMSLALPQGTSIDIPLTSSVANDLRALMKARLGYSEDAYIIDDCDD